MTTKTQLQNTIKEQEQQIKVISEQLAQERTRTNTLQAALDMKFEPLEPYNGKGPEWIVWSRNERRKNVVREAFKQIVEWAAANVGYSTTEDEIDALPEREATGLAGLVYLDHVEVYWAVRFAAEVCEQWNWHQESARLMALYERMIAAPERREVDQQTVSWWAD